MDDIKGLKHVSKGKLRKLSRMEFVLPLYHEIGLGMCYIRLIMILAKTVYKSSHTFLTSIFVTVERKRIRRSILGCLLIPVGISVKSNCHVVISVTSVVMQIAALLVLASLPFLVHVVRQNELSGVVCNILSLLRIAVSFPVSNILLVAIISVR